MSPLLAIAVGWALSRMFDVFKHDDGAERAPSPPPAPPGTPRRGTPARRSRRPTTPGTAAPGPTRPVSTAPAPAFEAVPWPQVAPTGLPPFPGAGWEPDEPPPPSVVQRAQQLLPQLWKGGPGTFKPEQTAGRWIIYRATPMGEKRGVVAFRESAHAAFLTPPGNSNAASSSTSTAVVPASASRTALPLLVRGSRGEEVKILQRKLGISDDGAFGPGTEAAVKDFQRKNGLVPDGKVGNATWTALLGRQAA